MKKSNLYLISSTIFLGLMISCNVEEKSSDGVQEVRPDDISSIIRNPISATKPLDTINLPKMTFEETEFDFGVVNEGDEVKHTFKFENTGKVALIINNAKSTCGCTIPKWPTRPIAPGEKGEINVVFNTENKPNYQEKPISITSNTYPNKTVVKLTGRVNPKKK